MSISARKVLDEVKPYIPGKPIEEVARELGLDPETIDKLASNENPLGPSPLALEAIQNAIKEVNFYPDDSNYTLKQKLSRKFGVSEDGIIIGNGSVELLLMLGLAYLDPGDHVVASDQSFIMYRIVSKMLGARITEPPLKDYRIDLEAIAKAIRPETKIVFLSNPNNPTATAVFREEADRFMEMVPDDVIVVWDEAYYEYTKDGELPDGIDYLKQGKNVVVLRTMSKAYGLAGLRIGYAFSKPEIIRSMMKVRLPFNVNRLAQIAAAAALDDEEHVRRSRKLVEEGKKYLYEKLEEMGLFVTESYTNFIFVETGHNGREIYEALLHKGVIVRPLGVYNFPTAIRVTVGLPEQNRRFIEALREFLFAHSKQKDGYEIPQHTGHAVGQSAGT